MTNPVKLCVNCKHCRRDAFYANCAHPLVRSIDPVYGQYKRCTTERYSTSTLCGPHGKLFEPKPTIWQRLKLWGAK